MKITFEQLPLSLQKNHVQFYLVSGDEILLVNEACEKIRSSLQERGFVDRECFDVDNSSLWANFVSAARNISIFREKKILELRLQNSKLDAAGTKIIIDFIEKPILDNALLIITPKLDSGWQKTKWINLLEKHGILLQIWPVEAAHLPGWIYQRLKQKGLIATTEVCKLLAERVEGNLLSAAQEVDRLALLYGSGELVVEQVLEAVAHNVRGNIFNFLDYAVRGDVKKAIMLFNNLQTEGVEPILILWALAKELRILLAIKQGVDSGVPIDQAIQAEKVFLKRILFVKRAIQRHNQVDLLSMLKQAAEIDCLLKGVISGDVWRALLQLTVSLAR